MDYSAGMVSTLLWWRETQLVAQLLRCGKSRDEIMAAAVDENIFDVKAVDRRRRIANLALKRVQALPDAMAAYFADADFRTAQFITLLSVMLTDRLFLEFCQELVYPAIMGQTLIITDADLAKFMNDKMNQSSKVAAFSDASIGKLKQSFSKFLFDGGILTGTKDRKIINPLLAVDFPELCRQTHMEAYYRFLTGGRL